MAMSAQQVVSELVERGLDPAVAEGIAMSLQDESGFDPGINEAAPIVPGSRGGFGLAQWTGPRRRALEAAAKEQGVSVADPEFQFDFLMQELEGPEARAMAALQGIDDPGQAAATFTEKFLRPAPEHLARRRAEYLGGEAGLNIDTAALPAAGLQEPEPVAPEDDEEEDPGVMGMNNPGAKAMGDMLQQLGYQWMMG